MVRRVSMGFISSPLPGQGVLTSVSLAHSLLRCLLVAPTLSILLFFDQGGLTSHCCATCPRKKNAKRWVDSPSYEPFLNSQCPCFSIFSLIQILQAHTRKLPISTDVNFDHIADTTEGFSGADLQALLYNAHLEVV